MKRPEVARDEAGLQEQELRTALLKTGCFFLKVECSGHREKAKPSEREKKRKVFASSVHGVLFPMPVQR